MSLRNSAASVRQLNHSRSMSPIPAAPGLTPQSDGKLSFLDPKSKELHKSSCYYIIGIKSFFDVRFMCRSKAMYAYIQLKMHHVHLCVSVYKQLGFIYIIHSEAVPKFY